MTGKVAIVSGAAEGIGAGLVAGYRKQGWTVGGERPHDHAVR